MFWLRNKKNNFLVCILIGRPGAPIYTQGHPGMTVTVSMSTSSFLAHLSRRPRGELLVYQWLWRPLSVRRPSVRQQFQTSSPLKPLGQLNSNFKWRLLRIGERKFVQMVPVTWPRWPPCPHIFLFFEVVRGMDYSNASSQQDDSEAWGGSPVNSYGNSGLQMEPASSTSDDFPGGGQVSHFWASRFENSLCCIWTTSNSYRLKTV